MSDLRYRLQVFFTERRIALIMRWWAAGAVYFFFGWGTNLGNQSSLIDFVFSLGVAMGLLNMVVVHPVLKMAFNIGPKRPPSYNTISQRISDYLVEIIKNIGFMFVIAMIYIALNSAINLAFGFSDETITIPGEPILFGIFYVLTHTLFERLKLLFIEKVRPK